MNRLQHVQSRLLVRCLIIGVTGMLLILLAHRYAQPFAVRATKLDLPAHLAASGSVAWLAANKLILANDDQLWYRSEVTQQWYSLSVASDPRCQTIYYYQLSPLPDGRLGMIKDCTGTWHDAAGRAFHTISSVVAYDLSSGQLSPLLSRSLPDSGQYSWSPDLTKGVFATIGAYSTLYWLNATGTEPLTLTLRKGNTTWRLSDSIIAQEMWRNSSKRTGFEPHLVGLVRDPAWAPNGKQIAFWATLETIGRSNDLPIVSWDIYVLDPISLRIERIVDGVSDPKDLRWSPDGKWLVYVSGASWWQSRGIWLFSLESKQSVLIQKGHYWDVGWSPDGQALVALRCTGEPCYTRELWSYDVGAIVALSS